MKFVKLSQKLKKYALNVRSVTLGYAHDKIIVQSFFLDFLIGSNLCECVGLWTAGVADNQLFSA
jgi:hypothetical protein